MPEHNILEGFHGTFNESLKLISAISYQANYVSWQWPEGKVDLTAQLYKISQCPQQWEEPSSSSNPQSDITSQEHLTILLRILSKNIYHYFFISLTWMFFICVCSNWHNLNTHTKQSSKLLAIKYNSLTSSVQPASPENFHIIINKKHFRPGGMAPSEWTRSVRAIRDTPVADYSASGANTMRRVAYRPPIVVSPFLLALSVSYCKWTLWRCGQLWPYVGMGSLGTSAKCKLVQKPHAGFHKHKAFRLSYSSSLQSQDSLPHSMACIIKVSLYISIRSIWPQMVVEHNRRF